MDFDMNLAWLAIRKDTGVMDYMVLYVYVF